MVSRQLAKLLNYTVYIYLYKALSMKNKQYHTIMLLLTRDSSTEIIFFHN